MGRPMEYSWIIGSRKGPVATLLNFLRREARFQGVDVDGADPFDGDIQVADDPAFDFLSPGVADLRF